MDPETLPVSKLKLFVTIANNFQLLTVVVRISAELTISTVGIFDKFEAAFSTYRIDIGSIQNMYQIDFLLY